MNPDRLHIGEWISAGASVLLFVFLFFQWYGLEISKQSNLLGYLRPLEDGGNAWQTLDVTPIFLALVIIATVGAVLRRLIGNWEPPVLLGPVICVLGALAACLILIRIIFPPELRGEFDIFDATLKAGIFLALAAACGIAYGGRRTMQEDGVSFAVLRPIRHRDQGQLPT